MNKEYFLIVRKMIKTDKETKDNYFVLDKFVCNGIRKAEEEFLRRNKKSNNEEFIIVKSERWIS